MKILLPFPRLFCRIHGLYIKNMTFAIIQTGGKQYKVSEKDVLEIEKIESLSSGDKLEIEEVLLVAKSDDDVMIGEPYILGAKVEFKVVDQVKGDKIRGYKYKAKKRYQVHYGHRQKYTEVEVVKISVGGTAKKAASPAKKEETEEKKAPTKKATAKKPAAKKADAPKKKAE